MNQVDELAALIAGWNDTPTESRAKPDTCDCCHRAKVLHQYSDEWLCGTCINRKERRINTREMYGKGRRGY